MNRAPAFDIYFKEYVPLLSREIQSLQYSLSFEEEATLLAKRFIYVLTILRYIELRGASTLLGIPTLSSFSPSLLKTYDEVFHTSIFTAWGGNEVILDSKPISEIISKFSLLSLKVELEDLALFCEELLCPQSPNLEGTFYTPVSVVEYIIKEAISPTQTNLHSLSILDPACGSGIFLIKAFKLLTNLLKPPASFEDRCHILQRIYGVDKNPLATSLTKLLLTLVLFEERQSSFVLSSLPNLSPQIQSGNSLLDETDFRLEDPKDNLLGVNLNAFSWRKSFSNVFDKGGFDCIIGNPPYGLSRDEQLLPEENKKLKEVYRHFLYGKVNKYLLFMAKGYELLNSKGSLCFIVPNAWLGIRSGYPLRKLFIDNQSLEHLTVFHKKVFKDLGVETVVVKLKKGRKSEHIKITHRDTPNEEASCFQIVNIPTKACRNDPDYRISLTWSEEVGTLHDYLCSTCIQLDSQDSPFMPRIALQAYLEGKGDPPQTKEQVKTHIFHCSTKEDETCFPCLEGSDILHFVCRWSGAYLKYGPWLAEPQTLEHFLGPRILIREIISPSPYLLSAAFVKDAYLYNKSVLHILPKENCTENDLFALLSILNSKLASFIIKEQGRKSQRKLFPKIVNDDLKCFPLPKDFKLISPVLSELARRAYKENNEELQREIDRKVYETYQLKNSHVETIEKKS